MMPRKCGTIPNSIGTSYWEYTYDGRGNLVSNDKYTRTTSGMAWQNEETYVYDETNHMVDAKNEQGEHSLYTYNGLGLRVGRELIMQDNTHGYTDFHDETPSVETGLNKPEVAVESYVIDYTSPTFRTLTMEEEGGFDYRWVYGLDKLSVKITSEGTNWWGQNVKQDILKDYLHQDRLGSTTNLTDKFGRVVGRADYNEWGEITYKDALDITSAYRRIYPQLNYTGHDWDDVLEMYYAKARFYDPDAKRFVELDPVKGQVTDPLSLVSYLYCVDNPLRWVDPLGLFFMYKHKWPDGKDYYIMTKQSKFDAVTAPLFPSNLQSIGHEVFDGGKLVGGTSVKESDVKMAMEQTYAYEIQNFKNNVAASHPYGAIVVAGYEVLTAGVGFFSEIPKNWKVSDRDKVIFEIMNDAGIATISSSRNFLSSAYAADKIVQDYSYLFNDIYTLDYKSIYEVGRAIHNNDIASVQPSINKLYSIYYHSIHDQLLSEEIGLAPAFFEDKGTVLLS